MMSFTTAVKTCLNKFITIEGRAQRSEFWWFFLFQILATIIPAGILAAIGLHSLALAAYYLVALILLAPGVCVAIRRLHDRDMNGWWILAFLIPLVGLLMFIVLALKGTAGENRFGPDPLA